MITGNTLQERINSCEFPHVREMFQGLYDAFEECICFDNGGLPDHLRNNNYDETTVAYINKHQQKTQKAVSPHVQQQQAKQERIAEYMYQVEDRGEDADAWTSEMQYREDENRLYRAQLSFVTMLSRCEENVAIKLDI